MSLWADLVSSVVEPGWDPQLCSRAGLSTVRYAEDSGLPAVRLPWPSPNLLSVLCPPHPPLKRGGAVEDFPFIFF